MHYDRCLVDETKQEVSFNILPHLCPRIVLNPGIIPFRYAHVQQWFEHNWSGLQHALGERWSPRVPSADPSLIGDAFESTGAKLAQAICAMGCTWQALLGGGGSCVLEGKEDRHCSRFGVR